MKIGFCLSVAEVEPSRVERLFIEHRQVALQPFQQRHILLRRADPFDRKEDMKSWARTFTALLFHMVTAGIGGKLNFAEYFGQLPERQPVGFVVAVVGVAIQRRNARPEEVLYRAVAILKVKENVVMPHKFFKFLRGFRCVVILIQAVLRVLIRV